MYNVLDIAKYVIASYWKSGTKITNLKLQKILYYIQGYSYKFCDDAAYPEQISKWPYGPVVPTAYFEYNMYRSSAIAEVSDDELTHIIKYLNNNKPLKNVIDKVIDKTIPMSAAELVNKTHEEDPWIKASNSASISPVAIARYFDRHNPLEIESDSHA